MPAEEDVVEEEGDYLNGMTCVDDAEAQRRTGLDQAQREVRLMYEAGQMVRLVFQTAG
jgi:hypothetical protein